MFHSETTTTTIRHCLWLVLSAILLVWTPRVPAQATKGAPPDDAPPPPLTYSGLVPGVSTVEEVRKTLGEPEHEGRWYEWKMLYPSKGRPGHFDAIYLQGSSGERGLLGNIEAASIPAGYETRAVITEKLGAPEFFLELSRQSLADYSEKGVRFHFDSKGQTIGVAYFPHGYPRVHSGERRLINLKGLPQGPQKSDSTSQGTVPTLWCGAAKADITPLEPDWLGPVRYVVRDALEARAVVLTSGGLKLALVGADIFGMQRSEIEPVAERLRKKGITHLIVAMSHCHTAGDPIGIYGFYPAKYVEHIQAGIYRAVIAALGKRRKVVDVRVASDELSLDGARVQGLFRNARNPGIVDPQLAVMQWIGEGAKPIATLVHSACHPEGIETPEGEPQVISADFPGVLCRAVESQTGAQAVFINGAVGGMVTGDTRLRSLEQTRAMGVRLAAEAQRLLGFAISTGTRLSIKRSRLEIPMTNQKMILFQKLSGRRPSYRGRVVTEMMLVQLGDTRLLTVPGELLPELSFEILERMPGYPRLIVGLANDQLGYMLPGYDFRENEYEESMSLGPATGPMVLQKAFQLLQK